MFEDEGEVAGKVEPAIAVERAGKAARFADDEGVAEVGGEVGGDLEVEDATERQALLTWI